jgi:Flp pilus assembly protein TadG
VEFALLAPVLCLFTAGVVDCTTLIIRSMEVKSAAQAGADVALVHGWDQTKIAQAVTAASSTGAVSADPAPTNTRKCVVGITITPATGQTCSGGIAPGDFVTVTAKSRYTPLVNWPVFGVDKDLVAEATVRLQ